MDARRQAALALHGLQEPDRAWMLGQLNEAERAQISHYLTELRDLGIPREPVQVPVAAAGTPAPPAAPPPMTALDRVKSAKPAQMRALLHEESADFVAAVLALEPWPWKPAYLARLARARRGAIEARLARRRGGPSAERLREALIARVDARLAQIGVRVNFAPKFTLTPFSWMRTRWTRR